MRKTVAKAVVLCLLLAGLVPLVTINTEGKIIIRQAEEKVRAEEVPGQDYGGYYNVYCPSFLQEKFFHPNRQKRIGDTYIFKRSPEGDLSTKISTSSSYRVYVTEISVYIGNTLCFHYYPQCSGTTMVIDGVTWNGWVSSIKVEAGTSVSVIISAFGQQCANYSNIAEGSYMMKMVLKADVQDVKTGSWYVYESSCAIDVFYDRTKPTESHTIATTDTTAEFSFTSSEYLWRYTVHYQWEGTGNWRQAGNYELGLSGNFVTSGEVYITDLTPGRTYEYYVDFEDLVRNGVYKPPQAPYPTFVAKDNMPPEITHFSVTPNPVKNEDIVYINWTADDTKTGNTTIDQTTGYIWYEDGTYKESIPVVEREGLYTPIQTAYGVLNVSAYLNGNYCVEVRGEDKAGNRVSSERTLNISRPPPEEPNEGDVPPEDPPQEDTTIIDKIRIWIKNWWPPWLIVQGKGVRANYTWEVSGTVKDTDGNPLSNANVKWDKATIRVFRKTASGGEEEVVGSPRTYTGVGSATTLSDGTYKITKSLEAPSLPAGATFSRVTLEYEVSANKDGYVGKTIDGSKSRTDALGGISVSNINFNLGAATLYADLPVNLKSEMGNLVPGAMVSCGGISGVTDVNGLVTLKGIGFTSTDPVRTVTVSKSHYRDYSRSVTLVSGTNPTLYINDFELLLTLRSFQFGYSVDGGKTWYWGSPAPPITLTEAQLAGESKVPLGFSVDTRLLQDGINYMFGLRGRDKQNKVFRGLTRFSSGIIIIDNEPDYVTISCADPTVEAWGGNWYWWDLKVQSHGTDGLMVLYLSDEKPTFIVDGNETTFPSYFTDTDNNSIGAFILSGRDASKVVRYHLFIPTQAPIGVYDILVTVSGYSSGVRTKILTKINIGETEGVPAIALLPEELFLGIGSTYWYIIVGLVAVTVIIVICIFLFSPVRLRKNILCDRYGICIGKKPKRRKR